MLQVTLDEDEEECEESLESLEIFKDIIQEIYEASR